MITRIPYLAPASLMILLGACGQSADPEAVLETVRATEQAQMEAIASKDLRGAVRNYESDAVIVAPGTISASGAAAIETAFGELFADPNLAFDITPAGGWAAASGDVAVTTYTARFTFTDPDTSEPVTLPLNGQTVWRKVAGEPWKIVSDYKVLLEDQGSSSKEQL